MEHEIIKGEFCIQCGDQFVSEWYEPQFTSYHLSSFDKVHIFRTKEMAEKIAIQFKNPEIKRIRKTIIIELEPNE